MTYATRLETGGGREVRLTEAACFRADEGVRASGDEGESGDGGNDLGEHCGRVGGGRELR